MKIFFNEDHIINNTFCSEQILLIPFLPSNFIRTNINFDDVTDYQSDMSLLIRRSNLDECDVILYPNKFDNTKYINQYIAMAREYNKPLLFFYNDDNDKPSVDIGVEYILYRTSVNKSTQKNNERVMPAWSKDFKKYNINITTRKKSKTPVIGFCGALTHKIRTNIINTLNIKSNNYKTNFLIRNQFWGGSPDNISLRKEFIKNTIDSDFIICARGAGNFSYRLYETLSSGRIPIFIDSDSVIPFEEKINFKDYFPIIKENDIGNIAKIILNFWDRIRDYSDLQLNLRELYENYFSPIGFVKQLNNEYNS